MKTTIEITSDKARITTEGFGFNTVFKLPRYELWEWHAIVADMIADHSAAAMGHFFPCPCPADNDCVANFEQGMAMFEKAYNKHSDSSV